ncbi:serine/threonine-protein kinase 12-like isoform X3 [Miscanthus floridulus]|uniref:serine/threonine-protein kinase 12-like isoform X3 n=1 Tax=Miscanthus floridulus TaxID=154761 RepID=UPI0034597462
MNPEHELQRAPALCGVWERVSVASLTLACAMRGDRDSNPEPSSHRRNSFRHQVIVLDKVRHPNVLQFVGAVTQDIPMMIVSELHEELIYSTMPFSHGKQVGVIFRPTSAFFGYHYCHEGLLYLFSTTVSSYAHSSV